MTEWRCSRREVAIDVDRLADCEWNGSVRWLHDVERSVVCRQKSARVRPVGGAVLCVLWLGVLGRCNR